MSRRYLYIRPSALECFALRTKSFAVRPLAVFPRLFLRDIRATDSARIPASTIKSRPSYFSFK
jgi:hypothetical protein